LKIAALPSNEELRLKKLHDMQLMDGPGDQYLDRLVELAGKITGMPISLITLVDRDRQWFKAKTGIDATETSREISFCSHTILEDGIMVVEDATEDERFFDNPEVSGGMHIRFYAGSPIVTSDGYKLGALCVIDREKRSLTEDQVEALNVLAGQVSHLLEMKYQLGEIRKRADELITRKTELLQNFVATRDQRRQEVAIHLNEEVAQSLSSAVQSLKMAPTENTFVRNALLAIEDAQGHINEMVSKLTPTTMLQISFKEFLDNLMCRFREESGLIIHFSAPSNCETLNGWLGLEIYRLLESYLEFRSKHGSNLDEMTVEVNCEEQTFKVCIRDAGMDLTFHERENMMLSSTLYYRLKSLDGQFYFRINGIDHPALVMEIPIPSHGNS